MRPSFRPGHLVPAGVVAGGDRVALVQPPRPAQERPELHVAVAVDAGRRRPPVEVGGQEWLEHAGLEFPLEVHDVERDVQTGGDAASVLSGIRRAAALLELRVRVGDVVEAHPHPDDVVALLVESAAATDESTPPDMATSGSRLVTIPHRGIAGSFAGHVEGDLPHRVTPRAAPMPPACARGRAARWRWLRRSRPRWSFGRASAAKRRAPPRPGSPSPRGRG